MCDVDVICSGATAASKASGFLLSILSPVWRAKLCGEMGGETRWQLALDGGEAFMFSKLIKLGSGESVTIEGGLGGVVALGLMADRYQVEAVQGAVEDAVVKLLTLENCGRFLTWSSGSGLVRVERASRELALREFEQFSTTSGFMEIGEEILGSLLDDDGLMTAREENVFEGVVRWMQGGDEGELRGTGLLRKVRFPFMEGDFLEDLSRQPHPECAELNGLLLDAVALSGMPRDDWDGQKLSHLDARVLVPRRATGLRWEDYVGGGERRLDAGQEAYSVEADGRHVCAGLHDGKIAVWNRSTLELERSLTGHTDIVWVLLCAGGRLISGSDDCGIRVWDAATGRCEGALEGHTDRVTSLAASGSRLVSGSWDESVMVWRMEGEAGSWQCERSREGQESSVYCLAAWDGRVASGSEDGVIRVWSAETWALERTLLGHEDFVSGLVVSGPRLISCSKDQTVRVWSTGEWECVQAVETHPAGSPQYIYRLAVSGATLVGGTSSSLPFAAEEYEVRVWDLETLEPLHALRQPAGQRVLSLMCDAGEVRGAVGGQVAVWGRRG